MEKNQNENQLLKQFKNYQIAYRLIVAISFLIIVPVLYLLVTALSFWSSSNQADSALPFIILSLLGYFIIPFTIFRLTRRYISRHPAPVMRKVKISLAIGIGLTSLPLGLLLVLFSNSFRIAQNPEEQILKKPDSSYFSSEMVDKKPQ